MPHPRQSAEEELAAAMLAVSSYTPGLQRMLPSGSPPVSQAELLATLSDGSDHEEIVFE
jgi:hypothetical protein